MEIIFFWLFFISLHLLRVVSLFRCAEGRKKGGEWSRPLRERERERENHQAIGYGLLADTKRRHYTDILQFKIGALFTAFRRRRRKKQTSCCARWSHLSGMDPSRFFSSSSEIKKKEQTHSYLNIITSINKNGGVSLMLFFSPLRVGSRLDRDPLQCVYGVGISI